MNNERTFKSVNDVSRYVNVYHACYVGNGTCAPFNRDVLRDWLRELDLTDKQINTFCDDHDIPHVGANEHDVMTDVIERLHGQYGCIMGAMDNTDNTVDVRTIDGDIATIHVNVTHEHDTVKSTNICELAHAVCKTCGIRVKWGLRVCDKCYANEHDTP